MAANALPFVSADQLRAELPIEAVVDAVEGAYRAVAAGADRSPVRAHVPFESGDLLLMPGLGPPGGAGFTVKLVTVVAENASRGLPTVQAVIVWFSAATGRPLAMIDGPTLTAMRTGAASGAATRLLARTNARRLAIIGVGAQAEWQLRAVVAVRPIEAIAVYARTAAARDHFAERMRHVTGLDIRAARSAEEAVRDADVVCCATTSSTPVFDAPWLTPGTHVNGVGAFRLDMVELPPELFARAAVVAIDSRAAALAEAGDLVAAIRSGVLPEARPIEIGTVEREWSEARPPDAITAFKSVGLAIQDVAAAELVVARLLPDVGP